MSPNKGEKSRSNSCTKLDLKARVGESYADDRHTSTQLCLYVSENARVNEPLMLQAGSHAAIEMEH